MLVVNVAGEKIPMFVIGKSKTTKCFQNVKSISRRYQDQPKIWMDSNLFEGWVKEINKFKKKTAALLVYKCSAHPRIENLPPAKLVLLQKIGKISKLHRIMAVVVDFEVVDFN